MAVDDDLIDDDRDGVVCPRCMGDRTVDCNCGGDLCVCLNYGERDCPVCHGEGEVSEEREGRYFEGQRRAAEAYRRVFGDPDRPTKEVVGYLIENLVLGGEMFTRSEVFAQMEADYRGPDGEAKRRVTTLYAAPAADADKLRIAVLENAIRNARRQLNDMQGDCVFYNLGSVLPEVVAQREAEALARPARPTKGRA